jgi:hypothetical protein
MPATGDGITVDNGLFLRTLFGPLAHYAHVCGFAGDPREPGHPTWGGGPAKRLLSGFRTGDNTYFCVSLFAGGRRTKVNFRQAHVLLLDDVGTKVDATKARELLGPPSYVLETSAGNFQWGYRLDPPTTDAQLFDRVQDALVKRLDGSGADPGQKGVTRYGRLPVGTNGKVTAGSWLVRVRQWHPHISVTLDEVGGWLQLSPVVPDKPVATNSTSRNISSKTSVQVVTGAEAPPDLRTLRAAVIAAADPVLQALMDLGMVLSGPRPTAMGLGYDVICPWVGEHTDRVSTGAVYCPGGRFKCHHGHCADRHHSADVGRQVDVLLQADSGGLDTLRRREFDEVDPAKVTPPDAMLAAMRAGEAVEARFFRDTVFVLTEDRFIDLSTGVWASAHALDAYWTKRLGDRLPVSNEKTGTRLRPQDWMRIDERSRQAKSQTYWPGHGALVRDATHECVNTWVPPARPLRDKGRIGRDDVMPWFRLLAHVVGNEGARAVLAAHDWMALVAGGGDVKAGFHLLVQGGQGIGKDLLLDPLRHAVGKSNVAEVGPWSLSSRFTYFAEARLVVVSEVKQTTRGAPNGHDLYSKLKMYLQNTTDWVDCEKKGLAPYPARNVGCWYFSSNDYDALQLEKDDRRFLVIGSEAKPWPKPDYDALTQWLDKGGRERVAEYLRQTWERMTAPRRLRLMGRAPMTRGKADLIDVSGNPIEEWLEDGITEAPGSPGYWPDIVTAKSLHGRLVQTIRDGTLGLAPHLRAPSVQRLSLMLQPVGAAKLNNGNPVRLRRGGRERFWAIRNRAKYVPYTHDMLSYLIPSGAGFVFSSPPKSP